MNRKKIWLLLGGMFFLLFIIGFILISQKSSSPSNLTANIEAEKENIEEVIDQVQEKDEEVENEENRSISNNLKDAVESTIGLFLRNDYKIVAIGDSLTQGVGDSADNDGYVGRIEDAFSNEDQRVSIDNFGKRGNRSDQLLKRLEDEEIRSSLEEADMILLTIGANDIMKVVKSNFMSLNEEPFIAERSAYEQRLQEIIDIMLDLSPDAEIYLIGFFNPFEGYFDDIEELDGILTDFNTTGKQLTTEKQQTHYIPTNDLFQIEDVDLLADDNFHPNATGYTLIAERILTYIRPIIEAAHEESENEEEASEAQ
ncbi:SGNH/GDSL hydrolase family protein [Paraliobacillus sediminis]|uniref:SGNH/GDSL hydrolase family protein n=1 Tax=Paraliobacillus sediminis TaxID=1885916 RepID=UPI000E3C8FAA|nr:SGNH/GDSL hydrolase family protein [Paraliobacillus sediminis]